MEHNKNRVFAYRLAKSIDNETLSQVAGGGGAAGLQMCSHTTLKPSGSSAQGLDAILDFSVDW